MGSKNEGTCDVQKDKLFFKDDGGFTWDNRAALCNFLYTTKVCELQLKATATL